MSNASEKDRTLSSTYHRVGSSSPTVEVVDGEFGPEPRTFTSSPGNLKTETVTLLTPRSLRVIGLKLVAAADEFDARDRVKRYVNTAEFRKGDTTGHGALDRAVREHMAPATHTDGELL